MGGRRRIVLVALVHALALTHAPALAQGAREKFDPRRDAAADLAVALARARAEAKRVIVDVGGEWCTWCHVMDRFIEANPDVAAAISDGFVWLKVNYSPANKNEELLSRLPKVEGYPHLFVLDSNGALLKSQRTSELESGSTYDKGKFLAFLKRSQGSK